MISQIEKEKKGGRGERWSEIRCEKDTYRFRFHSGYDQLKEKTSKAILGTREKKRKGRKYMGLGKKGWTEADCTSNPPSERNKVPPYPYLSWAEERGEEMGEKGGTQIRKDLGKKEKKKAVADYLYLLLPFRDLHPLYIGKKGKGRKSKTGRAVLGGWRHQFLRHHQFVGMPLNRQNREGETDRV